MFSESLGHQIGSLGKTLTSSLALVSNNTYYFVKSNWSKVSRESGILIALDPQGKRACRAEADLK